MSSLLESVPSCPLPSPSHSPPPHPLLSPSRQLSFSYLLSCIPTTFLLTSHSNCFHLLITQNNRIGSVLRAHTETPKEMTTSGEASYAVQTVLGVRPGTNRMAELYQLIARQLIQSIGISEKHAQKELILEIALMKKSKASAAAAATFTAIDNTTATVASTSASSDAGAYDSEGFPSLDQIRAIIACVLQNKLW